MTLIAFVLEKGEMKNKIAVIGAGNGGQAMAGHMAISGYQVRIYDVDREKIAALQKKGSITLKGDETGSTSNIRSTIHLEEAVKGAEVIMVVTAATSHDDVAKDIAPFLEDGQVILLNPGYFLGALAFSFALKKVDCEKDVMVADTESLVYSCRSEKPGEVFISGTKRSILVASFPGNRIHLFIEKIKEAYPQFRPAENVLETTFGNVNPVLHAPIALLNAGRIESRQEFLFYYDGGTRSIMNFEEKLDRERLAVASQFGIKARSIKELLTDFYEVTGSTLYDIVTTNPAYAPIKAPQSLQTRLITEDVPMGLVPVASVADKFRVGSPLHHALIDLASALMDVDYWSQGRTMENLGLAEMDRDAILKYLNEGHP